MSRPEKHEAFAMASGLPIARDPSLFEETAEKKKRRPEKARRSRNEINGLQDDWLCRTFFFVRTSLVMISGGSWTTRGMDKDDGNVYRTRG
ncbi:PREDICTED: uncharacterized protein LOC108756274 [Trachymyrmex septentrionalis]|uniref:uncharacterized protein LOC108756274 n=1 Tax=Trachymyrmex septentrionalis TaxID=34720 RepID=UPI00084F8607|nr:PREDICTED: uncharacterized protein LOC108756274 [Trachymyrmex septentrionalis]